MRGFQEKKFNDRLSTAQKAREEQLAKARAKMVELAAGAKDRAKERAAIAAARSDREMVRRAQKLEQAQRQAQERAAAETARVEAERLAEEERHRSANEEREKLTRLLADQKAARDARYAARKAKKR